MLGGEEQLTSYPSPRYCVYLFRHITYSLCRTVTHPDRLLNYSTIQGNYLPNKDCNYWLEKNTADYKIHHPIIVEVDTTGIEPMSPMTCVWVL